MDIRVLINSKQSFEQNSNLVITNRNDIKKSTSFSEKFSKLKSEYKEPIAGKQAKSKDSYHGNVIESRVEDKNNQFNSNSNNVKGTEDKKRGETGRLNELSDKKSLRDEDKSDISEEDNSLDDNLYNQILNFINDIKNILKDIEDNGQLENVSKISTADLSMNDFSINELEELIINSGKLLSTFTSSINKIDTNESKEAYVELQNILLEFEDHRMLSNNQVKEMKNLIDKIQQSINLNLKNNDTISLEDIGVSQNNEYVEDDANDTISIINNNNSDALDDHSELRVGSTVDDVLEIDKLESLIFDKGSDNSLVSSNTQKDIFGEVSSKLIQQSGVTQNDVIDQIIQKASLSLKEDNPEVKIKLKPDFLGEVTLKITLEKGLIVAKAVVESMEIKHLIESNLEKLRENFNEQGLSFEKIDVTVGQDSGQNNQNWNFSSGKKKVKINKNKIVEALEANSFYDKANNSTYLNNYDGSVDYRV